MTRAEVVEVPGEFSVRGGILDVFPTDSSDPVRIEFFGDEVESIRPFDAESQRSLDRWNSVTLTAAPRPRRGRPGRLRPSGRLLPRGDVGRPARAERPARRGAAVPRPDRRSTRGLFTVEASFERLIRFPTIAVSTLAADSLETTCHLRIESVERFSGDLAKVKAELDSAAAGDRVLIACHNAAEVERLGEVFSDTELAQSNRLLLTVGRIRSGFPPDRRPDAGHRRSRAVRPRRGPPARHPPPLREPGDRQLPRPERGRPGRPRQPRDRPVSRPALPRQVGRARRGDPAPRVRRGDQALRPDRQDRPGAEVRRRRQGRADALEDRLVVLGEAEEARRRGRRRPGPGADRHPGPARQPAGIRLSRARTATGWPSSRRRSPTRRRPTSSRPSRRSSATWPRASRWTA